MHGIFFEIFILSGTATLVATACSYIGIPTIVGFIFAGVIIGPTGFGVVDSLPSAYSLTEIVGIILLFTIGLEFPFSKLKDLKTQFFRLGTMQVVLSILVVSTFTFLLTDMLPQKTIVWGFLISLSSTALVLKLLHDYQEVHTPHGQNAIGILLFQDIAVLPMMFALPLIANFTSGTLTFASDDLLVWLVKLAALVVAIVFAKKTFLPFLLGLVLKTKSQELFFFGVISVTLGMGYLFNLANLSVALGAFVAGVIISETMFGHHTMTIFNSLRDTLLGLFFASVGMLLDLNFVLSNLGTVVLFGLLFFIAKASVIFFVCLINRVPLAKSIITALMLCQVGEFSFLLASKAAALGLFEHADSQFFLSVSIISMTFTSVLYLVAPKIAFSKALRQIHSIAPKFENAPLAESSKTPHSIMIGFGVAGRNIVSSLKALGISCKVIESNFKTVETERNRGTEIYFGDASFPDVLKQADLKNAKSVIIAISGASSVLHIISNIHHLRPDIEILVRTQYIHELRGIPKNAKIRIVTAEIETVTEMVKNTLHAYGAEDVSISRFSEETRSRLNEDANKILKYS